MVATGTYMFEYNVTLFQLYFVLLLANNNVDDHL